MSEEYRDTGTRFRRAWAMPNKSTFSIPPIADLIARYVANATVVIDPFAGWSSIATHRNDLRFGGKDAIEWLRELDVQADVVLLDPPYSPRQISECYESVGLKASMEDTQNARLYRLAKKELGRLLVPGGIAITCGWNSAGFGDGYEMVEVLLVAHGGAHNDTIVTVERKQQGHLL